MSIEIINTSKLIQQPEFLSYKRIYSGVQTDFCALLNTEDDCLIDIGRSADFIQDLLPNEVCLFIQNYKVNEPRIEPPKNAHKHSIHEHFSMFKFQDFQIFQASLHKSWWNGDFFFTDGILFKDLFDTEPSNVLVWDVTKKVINSLETYKILYAVMEEPAELLFFLPEREDTILSNVFEN